VLYGEGIFITARDAQTLKALQSDPTATASPARLEELASLLLNQGRGRGRKPASHDHLTERQLTERRRYEIPAGDNLARLRAAYRPNTGALHQVAR